MARAVMDQLERHGEVRRGRLGVSIQDLTPDLAAALSLDVDRGAVVSQVEPGSPAAEAGIRAGDVVVELNGRAVQGSTDFRNRIGLVPVGETVSLAIVRDGRRQTVTAKVAPAAQQASLGGAAQQRLAGATLRDIDPASPLAGRADGALVAEIEQGSPAWQAGLRQGDVITGVNRRRVRSVQELEAALQGQGQALALYVRRGEANLFIVVR
jgi:S1-C subfamily serine protease